MCTKCTEAKGAVSLCLRVQSNEEITAMLENDFKRNSIELQSYWFLYPEKRNCV